MGRVLILLLYLLCNDIFGTATQQASLLRLKKFYLSYDGLSITSFAYYPELSAQYLRWVDHTLGDDAVHYSWNVHHNPYKENLAAGIKHGKHQFRHFAATQGVLLPEELRNIAHNRSMLNSSAIRSHCAISLLGMVPENMYGQGPFSSNRNDASVGAVTLEPLFGSTANWTCYYRAVYTRFRPEKAEPMQTHWIVEFFCPHHVGSEQCNSMEHLREEALTSSPAAADNLIPSPAFLVHMHFTWRQMHWSAYIHIEINRIALNDDGQTGGLNAAICTAWPYNAYGGSQHVNSAMIFEFIRHHTNLGFKLFVYDRKFSFSWGKLMAGIFSSPYARAHLQLEGKGAKERYRSNILLHNFTMMSLLMPRHYDFDVGYSDTDKELTYSFCRYTAQNHHGYNRVLVIDFDEFILCRGATRRVTDEQGSRSSSMCDDSNYRCMMKENQVNHITSRLNELQGQEFDEWSMHKNVLSIDWHGSSPRECIEEQMALTSKVKEAAAMVGKNYSVDEIGSLFNCFNSSQYHDQNIKTFYMTRACAATGIHQSCTHNYHYCICRKFYGFDADCEIAHLTMTEKHYKALDSDAAHEADQLLIGANFTLAWDVANSFIPSP